PELLPEVIRENGLPIKIAEDVYGWKKAGEFKVNGQPVPLFTFPRWKRKQKNQNGRKLKADKPYLAKMDQKARDELKMRLGRIPRWSIAFLYMNHWIDYYEERIDQRVIERCEKIVKRALDENDDAANQNHLRESLEPISQIYFTGSDNANEIANRYLDIWETDNYSDLATALGVQLMRKIEVKGEAGPVRGVRFLVRPREIWKDLPHALEFALGVLQEGTENALKEEASGEISWEPRVVLSGQGDSLAKMIYLTKKFSGEEIKQKGLEFIKQKYSRLPSETEYSTKDITGAVNNQDKASAVWIRELVQNSRNALRRLLGGLGKASGKIEIRSYINRGKWIFSVFDPVGMPLDKILKKLLTPEATDNTLQDDVLAVLEENPEAESAKIAAEIRKHCFEEKYHQDKDLLRKLKSIISELGDDSEIAEAIVDKYKEKMKKQTGGMFGQGFFTVFNDGDEIFVRTGYEGKVYEVLLKPVYNEAKREILEDIHLEWMKEYADPKGEFKGTEIRRIKNINDSNRAGLNIESKYLHYQAMIQIGAISDYAVTWNGE
ncbi:hypothetical protein KAR10_09925, partial [bacterium]|nr:hypothetical protein [bacterium]